MELIDSKNSLLVEGIHWVSCVGHGSSVYGTLYDVGGTGILGTWYIITVGGTRYRYME